MSEAEATLKRSAMDVQREAEVSVILRSDQYASLSSLSSSVFFTVGSMLTDLGGKSDESF